MKEITYDTILDYLYSVFFNKNRSYSLEKEIKNHKRK